MWFSFKVKSPASWKLQRKWLGASQSILCQEPLRNIVGFFENQWSDLLSNNFYGMSFFKLNWYACKHTSYNTDIKKIQEITKLGHNQICTGNYKSTFSTTRSYYDITYSESIVTNSIIKRFSSCLVPNHCCFSLIGDSNGFRTKQKVSFSEGLFSPFGGVREGTERWRGGRNR